MIFFKLTAIILKINEGKPRKFLAENVCYTIISNFLEHKLRNPSGFEVKQSSYIKRLKQLHSNVSISSYKYQKVKNWLDIVQYTWCFISSLPSFSTYWRCVQNHIKRTNTALNFVKNKTSMRLKFAKLDVISIQLKVYSDASNFNSPTSLFGRIVWSSIDGSSQLGYITLFSDDTNKCEPLYWSSSCSKRVTKYVLGSGVMALADAFDISYSSKNDLQKMKFWPHIAYLLMTLFQRLL